MPKIDIDAAPLRTGTIYPEPYAQEVAGRSSRRLGDAGGLTQFGVNLVMLEPGAKSSLRHWHENEDEFVWITEGECTLIDDDGEHVMRPGDCAAFPAGSTNGHCFVNKSGKPAAFLVAGTRAKTEVAHYSDLDFLLHIGGGETRMTYRDGTPWKGPR